MKTHSLVLASDSRKDALHKIHGWKKPNSKSFTISNIKRYNYSVVTYRKNYFNFLVTYYSSKKEGKYLLGSFDWKHNVLHGQRFELIKTGL